MKAGHIMAMMILILTFFSVNLDFCILLLFLLQHYRLKDVLAGYFLGTTFLLILSFFLGQFLQLWLPEWLLGLLGILPLYLAFHDDDDEPDVTSASSAHGVWSIFITYLSVCSGCNLAIFLPVLAGQSFMLLLQAVIIVGGLSLVMVLVMKKVGDFPLVHNLLTRYGEVLMKVCYGLIALYVFWDSGLIRHLLAFL